MSERRQYGSGSLFKNGRTWWARYYVGGVRKTINTHLSEKDEAELMLEHLLRGQAVEVSAADEVKRTATGTAAELIVAADLLRRGFEVFRAVCQHASCDLMAMDDAGRILRVEVKSASEGNGNNVSIRRQIGKFDVLAILLRSGQIIYRPDLKIGQKVIHTSDSGDVLPKQENCDKIQ